VGRNESSPDKPLFRILADMDVEESIPGNPNRMELLLMTRAATDNPPPINGRPWRRIGPGNMVLSGGPNVERTLPRSKSSIGYQCLAISEAEIRAGKCPERLG